MSPDSPEYKYLLQIQKEEKSRAGSFLNEAAPKMDKESVQAVSELFSEISSRVRVVEEFLISHQDESNQFKSLKSSIDSVSPDASKGIRVGIADIPAASNVLSETIYNKDGLPYRFIFSDATLKTFFTMDRKQKSTLCIDIEYAKSMELLKLFELQIDGLRVRFRIANINGHLRLLAHLPKRQSSGPTHLRLIAPTMESNRDIALADIHCVPRLTPAGFFKKFFKDKR